MDERIRLTLDKKKYDFLLLVLENKVKFYDILREGKTDSNNENELIENLVNLYQTIKKYNKKDLVDGNEVVSIYLYPSKITILVKELVDFLLIFKKEDINFKKIEEYQVENATPLEEVDYKTLYEKEKREHKKTKREFEEYKERIANL